MKTLFVTLLSTLLLSAYSTHLSASCSPRTFSYNENNVLNAYIAFYGRPADAGGLAYWADRLDGANGDINLIIDAFGVSAEYDERFGSLSSSELVTNLYDQLFGRAPDQGGLDYYVGELESGSRTLQSISVDILNGAINDDLDIINNRNLVSKHFVTQAEATGITIQGDFYNSLLSTVTDSDTSASNACASTDSVIANGGEESVNFEYGSVTDTASNEITSGSGGTVELNGSVLSIGAGTLSESAEMTLYEVSLPASTGDQNGGQTILSNVSYVIGVDRDVELNGTATLTIPIDSTKLPANPQLSQFKLSTINGGFVIPQGPAVAFNASESTLTFSLDGAVLKEDLSHQTSGQPPMGAGFSFLLLIGTTLTGAAIAWNPLIATIDDITSTVTFDIYDTRYFNVKYRGDNVTLANVVDVGNALDSAYELFVRDMGFFLPNLFNFDLQYTVYLDDFSNQNYLKLAGGTDADGFTLPGSSLFEGASYVNVNPKKPTDKWVTTAVHEYFHAVQYGILENMTPNFLHAAIYSESGWLFEGSATALSGRVVYGHGATAARDYGLGFHLFQGESIYNPAQFPATDVAQDFFYYLEKAYGNVDFYYHMFDKLGYDYQTDEPTSVAAADKTIRELDPQGTDSLSSAFYDFAYDICVENNAEYGSFNAEFSATLNTSTTSASHTQKMPPLSYYIEDFKILKFDETSPTINQPQDLNLEISVPSNELDTIDAIITIIPSNSNFADYPKQVSLVPGETYKETLTGIRDTSFKTVKVVLINSGIKPEKSGNVAVTAEFETVTELGNHIAYYYRDSTNQTYGTGVMNLTSGQRWIVGDGEPIDLDRYGNLIREDDSGSIIINSNWGKGAAVDLTATSECQATSNAKVDTVSITDDGRIYYPGKYEYIYTNNSGDHIRRTNEGIVSCLDNGTGYFDVSFDANDSGTIDSFDSLSISYDLKVAKSGRPIAFGAYPRGENDVWLGVVDSSGAGFRWLTNLYEEDLSISDNGETVGFQLKSSHDRHMAVMSTNGGDIIDLEAASGLIFLTNGVGLSPDGSTVASVYANESYSEIGLILSSAYSGAVISKINTLTSVFPQSDPPQFTPDGQFIVFSGIPITNNVPESQLDIFIINIDGTGLRNLTNTSQISEDRVKVR